MLDFPSSELKDLLGQMQREMGPLDGRDNIYSLEGMADNTNGTGMGYPAGSNAAFEKWSELSTKPIRSCAIAKPLRAHAYVPCLGYTGLRYPASALR